MENENHHEYGQTDPDYIDQNTLVDGNLIQDENLFKKDNNSIENKTEFGESDPDYIDQNTLVDNDNYARDEDPYQYQEEFIEDLKHPENDFDINNTAKSEKIVDQNPKKEQNADETSDNDKN
ncbi:hypothetical protein [Flavobacterium hercynium]|uniref:Uncharacterized protein n=1 Tax=Flavobacterium hercynium TaxID=387094 RepID=A0A226GT32_9FLAO|nr:hypothetical protein [Flavobacterium hercynium]OXA84601.1 hypothetical protein B0A66_20705 [Flavobacterium hercynium]SMP37154.1 hypothetical protein SAMN06265346_12732 [Flavobacterium hercynium]